MNKDIRIAVSFKGHRKRKRLRRAIGERSDSHLLDLWITVAMDAPKGILVGWDEIDIADAANWEGDENEFVEALVETKWLDKGSDGIYSVHDWCDHQGWACHAEERSNSATKNTLKRWVLNELPKGKVKDFSRWYNDVYEYEKGHNSKAILLLYESYTVRNTPSPSPSPSPKDRAEKNNLVPHGDTCRQPPNKNRQKEENNNQPKVPSPPGEHDWEKTLGGWVNRTTGEVEAIDNDIDFT